MLFLSAVSTLLALTLAASHPAPRSKDSPDGVVFEADFEDYIYGAVKFSVEDGYVNVRVELENLPYNGTAISYEIHQVAVPPSGECYATEGVFDPYHGDKHAKVWADARVGDLSGKHGVIKSSSYSKAYQDPYLSLNPYNMAWFGDLSVVVRFPNNTIIACSNILEVDDKHKNGKISAKQNATANAGKNT